MAGFILMIGVGIMGLIAILKGEYHITKNKMVDSGVGKIIGLILLGGAILDFVLLQIYHGFFFISLISLIIGIVIGLANASTMEHISIEEYTARKK